MNKPQRRLNLVIPALFAGATPGKKLNVPVLETALARAQRQPRDFIASDSFEAHLFKLFGVQRDPNTDIPIAATTRLADTGIVDRGWWLRADPVHLQIQGDQLILRDPRSLAIAQDEAQALVQEILSVFAADDWYLEVGPPERWYLQLKSIPRIKTHALPQVVGKAVSAFFPNGADAPRWRATLNEIQMLLHASPINAKREAEGRLLINSLWFWGGGSLPVPDASWAQLWSNEPISIGLARLSHTPMAELPITGEAWLQQAITPGHHLLILDQGQQSAIYQEDLHAWQELMEQIDKAWIDPLLAALKRKELTSLVISDGTGIGFELTLAYWRRWWRRARALESYR